MGEQAIVAAGPQLVAVRVLLVTQCPSEGIHYLWPGLLVVAGQTLEESDYQAVFLHLVGRELAGSDLQTVGEAETQTDYECDSG